MPNPLRLYLARLGAALLCLSARTWRIRIRGEVVNGAAVFAYWHGDRLPVWKYFADSESVALASQVTDGGWIAQLSKCWGLKFDRIASSRDNSRTLSGMAAALQAGKRVLISADGAHGPQHAMKPDAVIAAHRAGVPLVLCRVHPKRVIRGKGRGRIFFPLPLASVELEFVTLDIAQDADSDVLQRLNTYAENLLKNLTPLL